MLRIQSIDLIKIFAMICVMGLHSTGIFVFKDNEIFLGNIIYRLCVCAIPLFFMVSGFLLLGRKKSDLNYSLKKCISIVRFVALCTIVYSLLSWLFCFLNDTPINYFYLFRNFIGAFIQKGKFSIFWYFGSMIIIYLLYPFINKIYTTNFKTYVILLFILFFIEFIVYSQQISHKVLKFDILSRTILDSTIPQTFRIWNWLFYFMLGGILKNDSMLSYFKPYLTIYTVLIIAIINVALQMTLLPALGKMECEYFYCSFFVITYSLTVFVYICTKHISNNRMITEMSNLFLPVYAFHMFVIDGLSKLEFVWNAIGFMSPVIFWITVSLTSLTISYLFMRIPYIKRIFTI